MTRFKKGQKRPPNAGRKRGSQNLTTRLLKDAVILAATELGDLSGIKNLNTEGVEHGKDGLIGYLRWAGKVHPQAFLQILARAMPMQVKVSNDTSERRAYRSLEEIERDIAARGFSIADFGHLLIEASAIEIKTADTTDEQGKKESAEGNSNDDKH